jgi:hypothetical protein
LAAPFDLENLELTGAALPVAKGVLQNAQGSAFFDVSASGRLVYRKPRPPLSKPSNCIKNPFAYGLDPCVRTFPRPGTSGGTTARRSVERSSGFPLPKVLELLLKPDEHWYRLRRE